VEPIGFDEENIADDEKAAQALMAYAKRQGGPAMVEFCFKNFDKLPSLVARSWKVEQVEEFMEQACKSRIEILLSACRMECTCGSQWIPTAQKLFLMNNLDPNVWREAMLTALREGRSKGSLVCHVGKAGNEGKSFLFRPLILVYGHDGVFTAPPQNAFPLIDLEQARMALLDDWRFNEDIVSYGLQLLWFEGAPFVIARPQNQYSGHLRYRKDDPVFITTLEADLKSLKGKKHLQQGDLEMMRKRLNVFRFVKKIDIPKKVAIGCPCCFAKWLLEGPVPQAAASSAAQPAAEIDHKRKATAGTGETPGAKKAASWSVDDVVTFLDSLSLGHVAPAFTDNAVDGAMLQCLSEEDMVKDLGLKPLQARKICQRLGSS
jgi:hypothetical protein